VHFDAEEIGLVGSRVFVESPPVPLAAMAMMVNLDMVGRLRRRPVQVRAGGATRDLRALVDSAAKLAGVETITAMDAGRSDHASFARVKVPTVMFTSGLHADYHRRTDFPSRIDAAGILRVVELAEGVIRLAGDRALPADEP
jgi:Zn-dependent M28 family amino/carboxypeptidase